MAKKHNDLAWMTLDPGNKGDSGRHCPNSSPLMYVAGGPRPRTRVERTSKYTLRARRNGLAGKHATTKVAR